MAPDLDLDAGAAGEGQAAGDLGERRGAVDALAVVRQVAAGQLAQHGFVAQAADGEHVQPLDPLRAEGVHGRLERPRLGLAGGGDAVGDEEDTRILRAVQPPAEPAERAPEIGGAERPAVRRRCTSAGPEAVRRPFIERHDLLVEGGDRDRGRAAGTGAQAGDQLAQPAHLRGIAQSARGARIDQHVEAGDLLRHAATGAATRTTARLPWRRPARFATSILGDLEVAVGGPVALVELDHAAVADLAAEVARRIAACRRTAAEEDADVEPADLRQAARGRT